MFIEMLVVIISGQRDFRRFYTFFFVLHCLNFYAKGTQNFFKGIYKKNEIIKGLLKTSWLMMCFIFENLAGSCVTHRNGLVEKLKT